jgi:hypothetical protein
MARLNMSYPPDNLVRAPLGRTATTAVQTSAADLFARTARLGRGGAPGLAGSGEHSAVNTATNEDQRPQPITAEKSDQCGAAWFDVSSRHSACMG